MIELTQHVVIESKVRCVVDTVWINIDQLIQAVCKLGTASRVALQCFI